MRNQLHTRNVEPFNLIGTRSTIQSRDDAKKIAGENSYYFFVVGVLVFATAAFTKFTSSSDAVTQLTLVFYGIFLIGSGLLVRYRVSRVAAFFLLVLGVSALFEQTLIRHKFGIVGFVDVLLVMAAIRSIKATLFYHRKNE